MSSSLLTLLGVGAAGASGDMPPVEGFTLWLDVLRGGSLWQDAGRATPAGPGQLLASWYDATTGQAATAAGGARPTITADGAAVEFATNTYLVAAIGARATPETLYVVAQALGGVNATHIFVDSASATYTGMVYSAAAQPFLSAFAGTRLTNSAAAHGARVAAGVVFNGGASVVRIGSTEVSGDTGGGGLGTGLTIGTGHNNNDGGALKRISALLRYPGAHDAAQRAAVVAWLAARHGVAL